MLHRLNYWTVLHWDAALWHHCDGAQLGAPATGLFWRWSVSIWVSSPPALSLLVCAGAGCWCVLHVGCCQAPVEPQEGMWCERLSKRVCCSAVRSRCSVDW